ncbi:MAG: metallophosphoesterase [Tepidisphaerales bacterium]
MSRMGRRVGRLGWACAVVAGSAVLGTAGLAAASFRIQPYLQQPSDTGMYFTWFTSSNVPGTLEVSGPGLSSPLTFTSSPELRPEMAYTTQELNQTISGLPQGSWLIPGDAYKHTVDVRSLLPNSTYTYTVRQGTEVFTRTFRTAPTASTWDRIRFIAMSDSETEPAGRVTRREWAPGFGGENRPAAPGSAWASRFGTASLGGVQVLRYAMTEQEGFTRNLQVVESRDPAFIMMPGDLVQGAGYQPGWDEFFRFTAGEFGDVLTRRAILPAYGNWETFAAASGGYGSSSDRRPVVRSRYRYKTFFDMPSNGTPAHQDNYYRIDYGPITIITLDSTKGDPEDFRSNYPPEQRLTGQQYTGPGTDTQSSFELAGYAAAAAQLGLVNDLSPYNPGSVQWNWARAQLADARARGQIIFVQFHHAPYSDGEHGLPMNHVDSSGQGGTPMRVYHPMFEEFSVAAVISGHSEMFERSFVDENGDGIGVHYYDVGISGDGLRGERRTSNGFTESNRLQYNPFSQWSADEHSRENWQLVDGVLQLVDGGKHYGHLEINVERLENFGDAYAMITLTPVYVFPVLDSQYNLLRTERRVYGDEIVLYVNAAGQVIPEPGALGVALLAGLGLCRRRR